MLVRRRLSTLLATNTTRSWPPKKRVTVPSPRGCVMPPVLHRLSTLLGWLSGRSVDSIVPAAQALFLPPSPPDRPVTALRSTSQPNGVSAIP
jgi:hypothetical protein